MKIAITGDIHGSQTWKQIDVSKYDKVILLGDYTDSYGDKTREEEIANLKEILEWKRANSDKVILLCGNHDINQYVLDEPCSRKAMHPYYEEIHELLFDNLSLFQIAVQFGDKVISHAGFTNTWMKMHNIKSIEDVNKRFQNKDFDIFAFDGVNEYGADVTQGPTWIRPEALLMDAAFKQQIIGHTQVRNAPQKITYNNNEAIIIESPNHDCILNIEV